MKLMFSSLAPCTMPFAQTFDEIVHKDNFFQDLDITLEIFFLFNNIDPFVCRSLAAFVYDVVSYRNSRLFVIK